METRIALSDHAIQRMAQRSIHASDIDLIMAIGSEVRDGILVSRKDCENLEKSLKSLLNRVRRLEGQRLVLSQGRVVTAYHASKIEKHKLLRRDTRH